MGKKMYAILIHGWAGSASVWNAIDWPDDWNTYAYTLPGHGDRRDEGPWTIPAAAEDLAETLSVP